MSVYSHRFAGSQITAAGTTSLYTVPAATTAVIRDIDVYGNFGSTEGINFTISVSGSTAAVIVQLNIAASGASAQWQGRTVLNAGEVLQCGTSVANWYVCVSGYLLS